MRVLILVLVGLGCHQTGWEYTARCVDADTAAYIDADGDGYYDEDSISADCVSGEIPVDLVDCNDEDPAINAFVTDDCDGVDNDCDGVVDDGAETREQHPDADGDGFGDTNVYVYDCVLRDGYVYETSDCDDTDANVNPFVVDDCDDIDNDCDGDVDDEGTVWWWPDADQDGYGNTAGETYIGCSPPGLYAPTYGDCDDTDAGVNPDATDTWYDGIDSDCDWASDYDQDGDGDNSDAYGGFDCDDLEPAINIFATETCDGVDNNCSGFESDASDVSTWYLDRDGDGYGYAGYSMLACDRPTGYVADGTDCDDSDGAIHPGSGC